jgi:uncharacterized protein (DUF885 family)
MPSTINTLSRKAVQHIMAALLVSSACVAPAYSAKPLANPHTKLQSIINAQWQDYLAANPTAATALGDHRYDDQLWDASLVFADNEAAKAQQFIRQLQAIPDGKLNAADATNKAVLLRLLQTQVRDNAFPERMMLFTTYASPWQSMASLAEGLPFERKADYQHYINRLMSFPDMNVELLNITKQAVQQGLTQPCVVMNGFEQSISGAVADPVEKTRFYAPFSGHKPSDASDAEWAALQAQAKQVISTSIVPEFAKAASYIHTDYMPHCRTTIGASELLNGKAYYAAQIAEHTTTNMSAEEIHAIGLSEVARIEKRMEALAAQAGYANVAAYSKHLHEAPEYFAKSPEELLRVAAYQAKQIDGLLPRYFGTLPRLPYGVKPIPAEIAPITTSAYYNGGSPETGISGTFFINTSKLNQRPLWELGALTAHEAVPGHHNQIARQQELPLPQFRKYETGFTAYVEGWALYSEYLGEEMGLYDTNEKMMGRLSLEMWRACRLVVDTGIHAKGWSKQQAIDFIKAHTALSEANIEAEVNRYISWPGQALGYKIGEIKIRALRAKAQAALGAKFDLRKFHDTVLGQGAVPLDVLEARVDAWVQSGGG